MFTVLKMRSVFLDRYYNFRKTNKKQEIHVTLLENLQETAARVLT